MVFDNGSVDSLAQMEQAGFTLTIERWQMMSTLLFRSQTNIYKAGIIFHFLELSLCHASILAVSLPPRLNRRLSSSSFRGSPLPFKRASRFLFGCHFSMILLILRFPPLFFFLFWCFSISHIFAIFALFGAFRILHLFLVFRCFCTQCLWIIFCGITGNKLSSVQEIILGSTTRIKKILKGDDFCKARNQTKRGVLPRHAKEIKTLRSH